MSLPLHQSKQLLHEAIGLWLAEGDNKSKYEITFTNNEPDLIYRFHRAMTVVFPKSTNKFRLYVYSPNDEKVELPVNVPRVNYYSDGRASRPYFIWRYASVDAMKCWKSAVSQALNNESSFASILRGLFAGEGSIKTGSRGHRSVCISQLQSPLIEVLLRHFGISYHYYSSNRTYEITHQDNWMKLAAINIADLHPEKKATFWRVFKTLKEPHYRKGRLRILVLELASDPLTSKRIASILNRSHARITEVLIQLRKDCLVECYGVGSTCYWIRSDENVVVISKLKASYLEFLGGSSKRTSQIARYFKVDWHSSSKRLRELERLQLVKQDDEGLWRVTACSKGVVII